MDTEEALRVADKAADRNTPAADHPSIVNMIYALEILANGYRLTRQKAEAWETSSRRMARRALDATATRDRAVKALESANEELDRTQGEWSGLMEFIRTALGLSPQFLGVDERALCDKTDPRSILGQVFADARLWARVKDMANGKFVAGDVVTADVINVLQDAAAQPDDSAPKDGRKWTFLSTWPDSGWTIVESGKWAVKDAAQTAPPPRHFAMGSAEPEGVRRVGRVSNPNVTFTRIGALPNGNGVWCRDDDDLVPLLEWSNVVRYLPAVEVP